MNSIRRIVSNCLCTACGTCSFTCPQKAISMKENIAGFLYADIDESKCIDCGLCRKTCPSDPDYSIIPKDPFHGDCIKSYLSYSTNPQIRQSSQSGGLVTSLLCYLLDNGLIDGAVVNRFNPDNNRTEAFFADSRDGIIKSAGSKYTQSSVIPIILQNKEKRLAAVTLGCQSESIYQLRKCCKKIDNLIYNIGLVCIGQNSGHLTDNLISQFETKNNEEILTFRSKDKDIGGWPGGVCARTSHNIYSLPKEKRLELKTVYEAYRCILCYDQMNVYSDIVCGDPWGIKHDGLKAGYTVVISRNQKGESLLKDAESAGYITLEEIKIQDVFKGQTVDNRHVNKVLCSKVIVEKEKWLYPYPKVSQFEKKEIIYDPKIRERLFYSRQYYLSDSRDVEKKLSFDQIKKAINEREKTKKASIMRVLISKIKKILK